MESNYKISKKEINRRINAYTTLIISFFISSIIFSFNYIMLYFNIFIYIILFIAVILFCTRVVVIKYFNSILNTKVILTKEYINKNNTRYLIKDINKIIIKRTTKGDIREIKLILNNKITYINNEIDNVEGFLKELNKYLSKDVIVNNIKEPIDYDHPTFYFFFGILVGFISIESIKLFINLNNEILNMINYLITLLSILMGIYFITYKPIYKRDEKINDNADYIWGVIFIIGGILVLLTIC